MPQHVSLAIAAIQSGRFQEAEQACRQALTDNPRDPVALNLLGVVAGSVGQHNAAADLMRKSIALAPSEASFRCNLANTLVTLGNLSEAQQTLEEAVALCKVDIEVLTLLGVVHGRLGHRLEAITALRQAVELAPESPVTHFNLGEACRQAGHEAEAIQQFRQTIQLDPRHANALNNLSGILLNQGDFRGSIECLEMLLQLRPKSCQVLCNLGSAMRAVGDIDQAIISFRRAVHLDPEALSPCFQLANLLIGTGEIDEGERLLERLRERKPNNAEFLATLARLRERQGRIEEAAEIIHQIEPGQLTSPQVTLAHAIVLEQQGHVEDAIERLEAVVDNSELVLKEGWSVRFRLGQYYDRLGKFEKAYENFQIANARRREATAVTHSTERHWALIEQIKQSWSADDFAKPLSLSIQGVAPIFIVGMPRSGTSLVEQILDSHPDVTGCGELTLMGDLLQKSWVDKQESDLPSGKEGTPRIECSGRALPYQIRRLSEEELEKIGRAYLHSLRAQTGNTPRATDKMPYNFLYLGWIRQIFPQATILHCSRHPLDTCLSCYFHEFLLGNEHTYDLQDLGAYYRGYQQLMAHWRSVGIDYHDVQYEHLVSDPEPRIRKILEYCGLEWNDQCLQFHKSARLVHTASYQQVRQAISTKSVHRWKNYAKHISPLIESIGMDSTDADFIETST